MLRLFCFILVGVIRWVIINHKRPIVVFIRIILLRGILGIWGWLLGEDLKGLCLFLLVSGSLITVFGFLLCLIPWEIGRREKGGGALVFLVRLIVGAAFENDYPEKGRVGASAFFDGGLGWEICVLIGVLLFLVMVLVVRFAPLKRGALRRYF